ncbi:MAG: recombinase family protein, partial [Clostridia bacterium]
AKLVRRIYGMFLQGQSAYAIARILNDENISTPTGRGKWYMSTVKSILTNEKYKGDALLQKTYTEDFLTKKKKINKGEVQQYYVKNNHEAIIEPEIFDMVQKLMGQTKSGKNRQSSVSIFSSKIRCGECGSWYGSKVWHSNDKYRRVIWQCNHKFDNDKKCSTPHLDEEKIKQVFVSAMNKLITSKEQILSDFEIIKEELFSTAELETEQAALENEMKIAAELTENCINENARVAQNQHEYNERYKSLADCYDKAKAKFDEVNKKIADKLARKETMELFMINLKKQSGAVTEFDESLWLSMIDYVTVNSKEDIRVTFKNGITVQA